MQEKIRNEIKQVLLELENTNQNELSELRAFHYNVHHIIYNPVIDLTCNEIVDAIKRELSLFNWT